MSNLKNDSGIESNNLEIKSNFKKDEIISNIIPSGFNIKSLKRYNFKDILEEKPNIPNFISFGDTFEHIYNNNEGISIKKYKKIDNDTKDVINKFFITFEKSNNGFRNIQHYLGFDDSLTSGVISFVNFVSDSKDSLNYFLDYNQDMKNMFYCYLHGVIFDWFYLTFTNAIDSKTLNNSLISPEIVSFFKCCGIHLYPAHAGYLDGICTKCKKEFELKSVGRQLDQINDIIQYDINGGTVSEDRFNELQKKEDRPNLLLYLLLKNNKYKNMINVPSDDYSIIKDKNKNKNNYYYSTKIKVNNIENIKIEIIKEKDEFTHLEKKSNNLNDYNNLESHMNKLIKNLKEIIKSRLEDIKDKLNKDYSVANMECYYDNLNKIDEQINIFNNEKNNLKITHIKNNIKNCMNNYRYSEPIKKGLLEIPNSNKPNKGLLEIPNSNLNNNIVKENNNDNLNNNFDMVLENNSNNNDNFNMVLENSNNMLQKNNSNSNNNVQKDNSNNNDKIKIKRPLLKPRRRKSKFKKDNNKIYTKDIN